ncbi:DUF4864 domain-containing protein [Alphaproteobacteria bacterium]|nr:DUF4864 domain-containing protein [Alphaproteobacteria bacterium]
MKLIIQIVFFCFMSSNLLALQEDSKSFELTKEIITQQIEAFKIEDAEKAYFFAAPYIKIRFDNSDVFMKMVKENYEPVSNPKSFYFMNSKFLNGSIYHQLQIVSQSNKIYIATYSLTLSGSEWKISGCSLSLMDQKSV